uniref:Uncharacterized protein n=1 Tax=Strongyloides venezuelensis TaxID=75913 RepID=A0A0K0FPS5_STRVS
MKLIVDSLQTIKNANSVNFKAEAMETDNNEELLNKLADQSKQIGGLKQLFLMNTELSTTLSPLTAEHCTAYNFFYLCRSHQTFINTRRH